MKENKMKIAVASDIHLEFGPVEFENPGVDVLILSGDITTANKIEFHMDFFDMCANKFPFVVYVMGNHEHYHWDFAHTANDIRAHLRKYPNIQFLDNEVWDLHDEIRFIGGTLWTDMNKEDPMTLHSMTGMMNDFRCVKNSTRKVTRKVPIYKKDAAGKHIEEKVGHVHSLVIDHHEFREYDATFSPEDAVAEHKKMLRLLEKTVSETPLHMKIVVVGHHAPSKSSTHPRYADETIMNGGYSSDLSEFMLDNPQIKLWTHGHTHEDFDYMIGSTRIVCNPRGYIHYEERADRFELKVIEV